MFGECGELAGLCIQSRCVVSRAQVSPGGLCQEASLFVSSANRLLQCWKQFTSTTGLSKQFQHQSYSTRSFTNNFCGIYHDRNHHQLWRLGSIDVTMLETIHKRHRAVQTISKPFLLHIRSFTNNFCGIYHDRNHHQLWRLGSRDFIKLETIRKHHRAVQTIYVASIRNHRQMWLG